MRGFISVIVVLAIFLVAITMLNVTYQQTETISFKEELLNEKLMFVNYEIAMDRAMNGQDLLTADLDGNSSAILTIIQPSFTTCDTTISLLNGGEATIDLSCTTNVRIRGETVFLNTFSKTITINS